MNILDYKTVAIDVDTCEDIRSQVEELHEQIKKLRGEMAIRILKSLNTKIEGYEFKEDEVVINTKTPSYMYVYNDGKLRLIMDVLNNNYLPEDQGDK